MEESGPLGRASLAHRLDRLGDHGPDPASVASRGSAARPALPDERVVAALRAGDERVFVELVRAHHALLHRTAMTYVSSRAVAEEVVQETWLAVLQDLERFEGRSSLRTWIFRIAANIGRTRAARERRSRPFSSMPGRAHDDAGSALDPESFLSADHPAWPGHWARRPVPWETPEERLLSRETRAVIRAAVERLPPSQRLVVTLRDIEGWSAEEACDALELTAANQRVLLHRARSKVRAALERHLGAADVVA
jgi:RNA polymerase sigma-70 factor (ECF subfamily)